MSMDPVSFLQLYCNQNNYKLDFTSISEQKSPGGAFTFRCDMENMNTTGSAPSKKRAKQVSARMMLCDMIEKKMFDNSNMNKANEVLEADLAKEAKENADKLGDDVENNPVSKLGELCVKKRWTLPTYDDEGMSGLAHERTFTVKCTLQNLNHTTAGEGSNKKAAKRFAAQKMLDYLKEENHDLVDEVLDRLPTSGDKKTEGTTFVDCIKKSKAQQVQFGKITFAKKIDSVNHALANNDYLWNYLQEVTKSNPTKFCLEELDQLSGEELEKILSEFGELGDFQVKKIRSKDESFICNVSLFSEKESITFFSWYGKNADKDAAYKQAFSFVLKAFIDEMVLNRD